MKQCPQCTLFSEDHAARCDCGYSFETGSSWDDGTTEFVGAAKLVKNGASWFYWIAGLSAVNSFLALLGIQVVFVVGMGMTGFLHGFLAGLLGIPVPSLGFDPRLLPVTIVEILVALSFVAVGRAASRGFGPAFVVGGLTYLLDAGLCFVSQQWLMLAFHALALFHIAQGYQASRTLRKASPENAAPRRTWQLVAQTAAPAVVFAPLVLVLVVVLALSSLQWNLVESQVLARAPQGFTESDRARLHDAYAAVEARFERDGEIFLEEAARMNEATMRIVNLSGGELASREQMLELVRILESVGGVTSPDDTASLRGEGGS